MAHLRHVPMIGGEAAIRKPYRMTAGYIWTLAPASQSDFAGFFATIPVGERIILRRQFDARLNTPATSSMGRLFDDDAALLGVRGEAIYEGQPAVELEALADPEVLDVYR